MRKPNPSLSSDRIAQAALTVLDQVGFAGFSLRGVARMLEVFPGALYWHFPGGREALLAAAAGQAIAGALPPRVQGQAWQDWLRALFHGYRAAIRAHPNVAPVLGSQLLSNTGVDFDLVEAVLAVLAEAGFSGGGLTSAYNVVIAATVGFTTLEFAPPPLDDPASWQDALRARTQSVDPARYPVLAAAMPTMANRAFVVRWENGSQVPLDDSFEVFVESVISGLADHLLRTVTGTDGPADCGGRFN